MSSDLSVATIWTTKADMDLDWAAGERAINALSADELGAHGYYELDDPEDQSELVECRRLTREDFDKVRHEWLMRDDPHEVAHLTLGPVRAMLTGGMSSGDDPTSFYAVLDAVPDSVYEAVGFYQ